MASGEFKRVLASVSLSGPLLGRLEAAAAAGFTAVEIAEGDLAISGLPAAELRKPLSDLGLSVDLYQPLRDIESVSDRQFQLNLARIDRALDLMLELGANVLQIASNAGPTAVNGDLGRAAAQLTEVAEHAARVGAIVAWEPIGWAKYLNRHSHGIEILNRSQHPALKLCLDLFHWACAPEPLDVVRSIPADRIAIVQVSDKPRMDGDLLAISRVHRLMPGEGDADVEGYFAAVAATGYRGPISLEIFDERGRHGDPLHAARVGAASLDYLVGRAMALQPDSPVTAWATREPAGVASVEVPSATAAIIDALGLAHDTITAGPVGRIGRVTWSAGDAGTAERVELLGETTPVPFHVSRDAPSTAIDHITLATELLDESLLILRAGLGLSVPRGAQAAGARSPQRPLVATASNGRVVARLDHREAGMGPALDGVALVTDDIRRVARRAADLGHAQRIPRGYFDILRVRTSFTDSEIAEYRELNLTADRDEHTGATVLRLTVPTPGVLIEVIQRDAGTISTGEADVVFLRLARAFELPPGDPSQQSGAT